jgi:hypothetical protein
MAGNLQLDRKAMKFYGYTSFHEDSVLDPLEEVTLCATPHELKSLAHFLLHVAIEMDRHKERFGHEHFADFVDEPSKRPSFVVTRLTDDEQ